MPQKNGSGVDPTAFAHAEETIAVVRGVADDLWTITAACAGNDDAMEALGRYADLVRMVLHEKGGDVELIRLGVSEWVHELEAAERGTTRTPS